MMAPDLHPALERLRRRQRRADALDSAIWWAPVGAAVAIALIGFGRMVPAAWVEPVAVIAAGCLIGVPVAAHFLRRVSLLAVARRVDMNCDLHDRLATALVFERDLHGDEAASIEDVRMPDSFDRVERAHLLDLQRADALAAVVEVRPEEAYPYVVPRRRLTVAASLGAIAIVLSLLPNPQDLILAKQAAVQTAAKAEAERLEAIVSDQADPAGLSPEEQEAFEAALAALVERLKANPGSVEQALSDIAAADAQLESLQDPAAENRARAAGGLSERLSTLAASAAGPSVAADPAGGTGDTGAGGEGGAPGGGEPGASDGKDLLADLEGLAAALDAMTPEEQARAAEILAGMAGEAAAAGAAGELESLAGAVQNGDAAAAAAAAEALAAAVEGALAEAAGNAALDSARDAVAASREPIAAAGAEGSSAQAGSAGGRADGSSSRGSSSAQGFGYWAARVRRLERCQTSRRSGPRRGGRFRAGR
jgi:hypothetical protein